ncbi:hypothetical protein BLNAU_24099 [Blattamonas nauphoetae]|uniref:Uncharacterized protein n=1 Tax=Blattamonas nauphoetae TaxID=2049346 RepID=A0ABQ9WNC1_9EUKA|nr:hypothetical protein BLNAU_24099 [Blattamonas nauphoetae]
MTALAQAKFQQLASSLMGQRTVRPHLCIHHSLLPTPLLKPSSTLLFGFSRRLPFRQESLQLLNILHSLLTSPLLLSHQTVSKRKLRPKTRTCRTGQRQFLRDLRLFALRRARQREAGCSLVRCKSVCELVGAEKFWTSQTSSIELSLHLGQLTLFFAKLRFAVPVF